MLPKEMIDVYSDRYSNYPGLLHIVSIYWNVKLYPVDTYSHYLFIKNIL